jgi:predicted transposase YbfD/YdcC
MAVNCEATIRETEVRGIIDHFQDLPDPRSPINRRHLLVDVIVICMCGVIAGADGPVGIEEWGKTQIELLKKYLRLPYGIPSHDTIGRVLEALRPQAFQQCFAAWLESLGSQGHNENKTENSVAEKRHLAIDGKTMRRSHDRRRGLGPLHMVSVWSTARGIALGQLATEEKSNEITAIPELLDQVDIKNAVVTIDAAGCQKNIAAKIIDGGGDYLLAVKGNQEKLHQAVQACINDHLADDFARVSVSRYEEHEKSHGRVEHRYYYQLTAPSDLAEREKWKGLKTIGVAIRGTEENGKETSDVRYYISSLRRHGKRFARFVRGHWGIENTLHWCLDVTFREDESRARGRRIADNLSWLRRIALTLLKQHPKKQTIAMKRRIAGWCCTFLMEVLTGKRT